MVLQFSHNLGIYLKCMKRIEKLHGTCDCAGSVFLLTKEGAQWKGMDFAVLYEKFSLKADI